MRGPEALTEQKCTTTATTEPVSDGVAGRRCERSDDDHERQSQMSGGHEPTGGDEGGLSRQRESCGPAEPQAREGGVAELRGDGKQHGVRGDTGSQGLFWSVLGADEGDGPDRGARPAPQLQRQAHEGEVADRVGR